MGDTAGTGSHRRRLSDAIVNVVTSQAAEAVTVLDASGRVQYASPNWADVLGIDPTDAVGRTPFELIPFEEAARVDRQVQAHLRQGRRSFSIEGAGGRNGERVWLYHCEARYDDPAVRGLVVLTRDVTDERAARRDLNLRRRGEEIALDILRRRAVLPRDDLGRWTAEALEVLGMASGADRATVLTFDPSAGIVVGLQEWTAPGAEPGPRGSGSFAVFGARRVEAWVRAGRMVDLQRSTLEPAKPFRQLVHETRGAVSILVQPTLTARGPGLLLLECIHDERQWPPWVPSVLLAVTEPIAASLDEQIRSAAAAHALAGEDVLATLARRLLRSSFDNLETVLAWFVDQAGRHLGAECVTLGCLDSDGRRLRHRPIWIAGGMAAGIPVTRRVSLQDIHDLETLVTAKVLDDQEEHWRSSQTLLGPVAGAARIIAAPLVTNRRTLGVLAAGVPETDRSKDPADVRFLRTAADTITGALLRAEAHRRLRAQVTTDPLTGLGNRRALLDHLDALVSRRQARPAVAFLDLNGFKAVNDVLGHGAGDELLRSIAARLDGIARRDELVVRLGGDEFVVVADHVADADAARRLGERFATSLASVDLPDGTTIDVRAAVGAVIGGPASTDEWLRTADEAMYEAKQRRDGSVVVRVVTGS